MDIIWIASAAIFAYIALCLYKPVKRDGQQRLGMRIVNASRRIHDSGKEN
jgi:hypothetical protein